MSIRAGKAGRAGSWIAATVAFVAGAHAQAAPEWCNANGVNRIGLAGIDSAFVDDPRQALPNLVAASCGADRDSVARAKEIEAAREKWNQRLDMTAADWGTDVVAWATRGPAERSSTQLKLDARQAPSSYTPIDQYAAIAYTSYSDGDPHYLADALEGRLSEAGRLAYIQICLGSRRPVEWAMCQPDIDAFDAAKLSAELRADKQRAGHDRMTVRIASYLLRPKLVERATAVQQLVAKDPGYKQLFAIAAQTRREWASRVDDAKLLELVLAMDDARVTGSNRAFEGCDDTTWAAFSSAVSAIGAKKFVGLKDEPGTPFLHGAMGVLINDPRAYLASVALHTCKSTKPDALIRFLGAAMRRWPGFRGPRNATLTAMRTAEITLDDRAARLEFPEVRRWFAGGGSTGGGGRGPVAAVKRSGATTVVEFVKKLRKEQVCTDWKDTRQIVQITPSGSVIHGYDCLKHGTITVNDAPPPRTVNSRYAGGVKVGGSVSITEDVVAAAWARLDAPPVAVLGVPVK